MADTDYAAWQDLRNEVEVCTRCPLYRTRSGPVCGVGPRDARIMLVGQAPGDTEDRTGRLWTGPAGKILDRLLVAAGLTRREIYLTNLLKSRLPGYRRPKMSEIDACLPYLLREIELLAPAVIASLGYYATKTLLEHFGLGNPQRSEYRALYGRPHEVGPRMLLVPLQNPASLIPAPETEAKVLSNYAVLRRVLQGG